MKFLIFENTIFRTILSNVFNEWPNCVNWNFAKCLKLYNTNTNSYADTLLPNLFDPFCNKVLILLSAMPRQFIAIFQKGKDDFGTFLVYYRSTSKSD